MKKTQNNSGNIVVVTLFIILIIAVVGGAYLVYHKNKSNSTSKNTSSSSSSTTKSTSQTKTQPDIYAGWKTFCDTTYGYCFKYPSTWSIDSNVAPRVGITAQTTLLNSTKTVSVSYINAFTHDSSPMPFTPTYINKLTSSKQDLTVVGGFSPASGLVGNYLATYRVVDSSFLRTYPLTVGSQANFPNNPSFTDMNTGSTTYQGELESVPTTSVNTTTEAQAWLNSADAQTSVSILKSFYYNKQLSTVC